MTIWFDVEDMVHYFRVGNKRISGIQRVSFEIFQAAMSLVDKDVAIGFVRHGTKPLTLIPVAWEDLLADFGDAESPTPLQPEPPPPELEPDLPASPPHVASANHRSPVGWREPPWTGSRPKSGARSCWRA